MPKRINPIIFLCAVLTAALLLNPPAAFAARLPAACNIFNKDQIDKTGPCEFKAACSKFQCLEGKDIQVSETGTENWPSICSHEKQLFFLPPLPAIPGFRPLLC